MGDISPHFNRSEFECQCGCGFNTVDVETIAILEDVRQHFMKPIQITSGCRCAKHNRSIGGAKKSKHIFGNAVDFQVASTDPETVYNYIDSKCPNIYGLGLYSSWVHFDPRAGRARWRK